MTIKAREVHTVKGGVTVRDYRRTGLCPPNGGRITPLVYVQHIPVIRNAPGIGDGIVLGNVLKQQGLAVANGTDAEGNIFLYTKMNELCYHARGSNFNSTGTEHMHYSVTEPWTERQYRAAAWLAWYAWKSYGIPLQNGSLRKTLPGQLVPVAKKGHVTHKRQSVAAGYSDRGDPGTLFKRGHVYDLALYYGKHHNFRGAPTL